MLHIVSIRDAKLERDNSNQNGHRKTTRFTYVISTHNRTAHFVLNGSCQ